MKIEIVPYGNVDGSIVAHLQEELFRLLNAVVRIGYTQAMPPQAYNAKRKQYLSTDILDDLARLKSEDADRFLAVVDLDLYVPELNFVFGTAYSDKDVCVIALPRLRQDFYGLPADRDLFLTRALKEAVHELGHTFGLGHCRDRSCVMFFSNTLNDTDAKGSAFCPRCQIFVNRAFAERR